MGNFLNNLGERLGVDLASAAEGLGLDIGRFTSPRSQDSDFEPRTDIFDTATHYIIHVSLPGAKKSDIGVEWDDEHSVLRVAGVVHRPETDEEMLAHLAVDGRKRETGVFEKNLRLGTPKEPASVDVTGITAKMVDGVLVVSIPKTEKQFVRKQVRVNSSPGAVSVDHPHEDIHMDEDDSASASTSATKDKQRDARSETLGFEHANATVDTLPLYEPAFGNVANNSKDNSQHQRHEKSAYGVRGAHEDNMSDWEKDGSDDEGEGEYVKINVN